VPQRLHRILTCVRNTDSNMSLSDVPLPSANCSEPGAQQPKLFCRRNVANIAPAGKERLQKEEASYAPAASSCRQSACVAEAPTRLTSYVSMMVAG